MGGKARRSFQEKTSYDKFMAALANHSMYAVLAISPDGTPWNGMAPRIDAATAVWHDHTAVAGHHGSPNIPPGNDGCTLERNNGPTGKAGETCYPPCLLTYGKMVTSPPRPRSRRCMEHRSHTSRPCMEHRSHISRRCMERGSHTSRRCMEHGSHTLDACHLYMKTYLRAMAAMAH